MNELLKKLIEQRDAAVKQFEDFATPLLGENRELSKDEEKRHDSLLKDVKRFDKRIGEIREQTEREAKLAEARAEVAASTVVVRNEPKTYGEGSPNSYCADLVRASSPVWKGHDEAIQRLQKHSHEMAVDSSTDSETRKRVTKQLREANRTENGIEARKSLSTMLETRAMDTTAPSGGSFVTPIYDVADYAPYRQFGRVFIDQCHKESLPEYGMTVFLPHVTAAAGVAVQATQGSGVQETDPTAGYLSSNLSTEAGQVTISQQLLDRAGPNFQFDKMVFDQLQRAYNFVINQAVLTAALAGAGSVSRASQVTVPTMYADVANAKQATVNAAGTVLPATHMFATPTQWEWAASRVDPNGRPFILPTAHGPFNAMSAEGGASLEQGDTGYRMLGLRVFEDGGVPLVSSNTQQQVVVAHMPEVWVFEGDTVPRVIPQTFAQNLQVLLQIYAYYTVIVRYPLAVQSIAGAGYPAAPTF